MLYLKNFEKKLINLPEGSFYAQYKKLKYLATKSVMSKGGVIKFYAYELGGNDFVSCNFYMTKGKNILKPCEMSPDKVIDFVINAQLLKDEGTK